MTRWPTNWSASTTQPSPPPAWRGRTSSAAARLYAAPGNSAIVYGLDNVPGEITRDCVIALCDLALLTHNVGQPAGGLFPMRQGANTQGATDIGCIPNRLPGGGPLFDDDNRARVENFWGVTLPPPEDSMGVEEMLAAATNGDIKSMIVISDSPNFTNGLLGDGLAALERLDFLAVMDTFLTPTAQIADVVLPRVTFAEKDGTFTNLERRIQRVRPAVSVKNNDAKSEGWVFEQLSQRLGIDGISYDNPSELMDEIAAITANYGGISYERLARESVLVMQTGVEAPRPTQLLYTSREERGIQWPCPSDDSPSSPVLYSDGFPYGKAEPVAPRFRQAEWPADSEFPALLAPGRVLLQRERETGIEAGDLNRIVRDELVQLNPTDAAAWNIADGEPVAIATAGNRITGVASLDAAVPSGVAAITTLFGELAIELQTSEDINPMARVPGLVVEPCRVESLNS